MKLNNLLTEDFKGVHSDIDRIFTWLKDIKSDKDSTSAINKKVEYIEGRLKKVEEEIPKDNLDFAKKVFTDILDLPKKIFGSKIPK